MKETRNSKPIQMEDKVNALKALPELPRTCVAVVEKSIYHAQSRRRIEPVEPQNKEDSI